MLALKEPIPLQSVRQPLTLSEGFGEKIIANYQMMSARFTPKDLLLLLVAPPEYPDLVGGGTSIAMQTDVRNTQNTLIEIVNNVTNRILLMNRQDFTYQDQVYISTFLEKIGITDVAGFIREVHSLTQETRGIQKLLSLYQDNFALLEQAVQKHKPPKVPRKQKKESKRQEAPALPRPLTLHQEIFSRLETGEICRIVQRFQQNNALRRETLSPTELRTANFLRQVNLLALAQAKSSLFLQGEPAELHHVNRYETGEILPPPVNEGEVLSQGAAAAVLDLVENVMATRMNQYVAQRDFWVDIRHAVSQSARNSLARFEQFHTHLNPLETRKGAEHSRRTHMLQREEIRMVERFLEDTVRANPEVTLQRAGDRYRADHRRQEQLTVTNQGSRYLEALLQVNQVQSRMALSQRYALGDTQTSITNLLESPVLSAESKTILRQQFGAPPAAPVPPPAAGGPQADHQPLEQREEAQTRPEAAAERIREIWERDGEELRRRLEEINRQNILRHRQVLERQEERSALAMPREPDRERTFRGALEALEHPEEAMKALLENSRPPEPTAVVPPGAEILLAQTDAETRQIFEAVFRYQMNPQEAIRQGLVRPGSEAMLNEQVRAMGEITAKTVRQIAHLEEESGRLRQEVGRISPVQTMQAGQSAGWGAGGETSLPRARVPTVHKVTETGVSEELLERLEQQRRIRETGTTVVSQTTAQQTVEQVVVNRQGAEMVQKTTDDIVDLVNRTLARQIGSISDQVLGRMERRLELDRARRGRY